MQKILFLLFISIPFYGILAQSATILIQNANKEPISSVQLLDHEHRAIGLSNDSGTILVPAFSSAMYTVKRLGYDAQSFHIHEGMNTIILQGKKSKQVEIKAKKIDEDKMTAIEVIDKCELGKLACCNLAESFENSNTVDVNYSDGITGGREIQMLGLAGTYSQQLLEGTPYQRGILSKIGLELVPGPWLEGISINKGIGSVVNGYDNISGQINLEFMKPKKSLDWFVNGYISEIAKTDLNLVKGFQLNENLYTSILAHTQFSQITMDNNHDGFTDMPKFTNFNLMNRWFYMGDNGLMVNAAIQAMRYDYQAGQILEHSSHSASSPYTIGQTTNSYQAMLKTGWELDAVKESSVAVMYRFNYANQSGNIAKRLQDNEEIFFNISPVYQTKLSNTLKWKGGLQILHDNVKEQLDTLRFSKNEWVPGAFSEFLYSKEHIDIVAGLRGDYHNTLGFFISPRASIQFKPNEHHILKLSSGIGFRTPTYLTEASGFLISNRSVILPSTLQAEKGWNSGLSYKYLFNFLGNKSSIEASYFLTIFQNQMILNAETPELLKLEYIQDQSRAQSFQVETDLQFTPNWSLRLSYKNDQTVANFDGEMKNIPLLKNDKYLANLYYTASNQKWRFSTTLLLNGSSRIPSLTGRSENYSPFYPVLHAQINYLPNKKMDFYIGAENITSYNQSDRIYFANNVENKSFDAGMIWGPMDLRRMYVGGKITF